MFTKHSITYCAPTLADLKSGSLFRYTFTPEEDKRQQLKYYNQILQKGVSLMAFNTGADRLWSMLTEYPD